MPACFRPCVSATDSTASQMLPAGTPAPMQTLIFLPLTTSGTTAVAYAFDSAPQISGSQPAFLPSSVGRPSMIVPTDDVSSVRPLTASARLRPSSFDQKPNVSAFANAD